MKSQPQFIYFDLGNVLLNFDHEIACQNLAKLCGKDSGIIRRALFESGLQEDYEAGLLTTEAFHGRFCNDVGVNPGLEEACQAASAIFSANESVFAIIRQLWRAGNRLGILSNTCDVHWNYVMDGRYPILNECFEVYVLSFAEKCSKPFRQIYEKAVQKTGLTPSEVFFVDDRLENVKMAKVIGIDSIQYQGALGLKKELLDRNLPVGD
ncbi:MAG: HAD family phosphatase [Planctomycetota bacterium]|nr:HAD family phosphatase [Planctomycetota bacterium]